MDEKLKELLKQLEAAETLEEVEAIKAQIEELQKQMAMADEKKAILDGMKSIEPVEGTKCDNAPKTLGDFAVKSWDGKMVKRSGLNLSAPEFKTQAATDVHTSVQVTDYDHNVVGVRLPLNIESLFGAETISGNALTYYVEGAKAGSLASAVAEGGHKNPINFVTEPKTVPLAKLAGYLKESDEMIEDTPWLKSSIDGRLQYELQMAVQSYLLTSLTGTSGIGAGTWAKNGTETVIADKILDAIMGIEQTTGIAPDAIVMTPAIYAILRKGKQSNGQYYGGGYFGEQSVPSIWGLPVVVNANAGGVIVGAFKAGASVVSKGGISVEMTNSNDKDFENNLVTLRAERRMALAVRRPACFTKLTEATS